MFDKCQKTPRCERARVPLADLTIKYTHEAAGKKAFAIPAIKTIFIDPTWWQSLHYTDGRMVIFAHEWAHVEGARCEPCADFGAGVLMRELGFPTSRDARRTMRAALDNRDPIAAEQAVAQGFGEAYGIDNAADAPELKGLTMRSDTGYRNGVAFPVQLVEVEPGQWLSLEAGAAYLRAKKKAAAAGVQGSLESSFRTMAKQQELAALYKAGKGNLAAEPGHSAHQRGDGGDIKAATLAIRERFGSFLLAEGFKKDVPSESWHFTFHGAPKRALVASVGTLLVLALVGVVLGAL